MNKYQEYFNEFFRDEYSFIHSRLQSQMEIKKDEYLNCLERVSCVEDIPFYVDRKVVHSGNEDVRSVILKFYDFLLKKYNINIESNLKEKKLISNPLTRELEIAKFIHEKKTRKDIMEEFSISERELREELSDLRNGISIMDTEIKLNIKDIDGRRLDCSSTVHPIFLPLNLTEIYALMCYLPRILKDTFYPNAAVIVDILEKIKPQLSDYALSILHIEDFTNNRIKFYEEKELIENGKKWQIINAMKGQYKCKFYLDDEIVEGTIKDDSTIITTDLREIKVDFDNIDFNYEE